MNERTIEDRILEYREKHPEAALAVSVVSPDGLFSSVFGAEENSRFEIGSITKLFTAILISEAANEGKCELNDPLNKFVPCAARNTTLRGLLTHTSGWPRLPIGMFLSGELFSRQPYRRWKKDRLERCIRLGFTYGLKRGRFGYSNLGYAALGLAIERMSSQDYSSMARDLLSRLGMRMASLEPEAQDLQGHGLKGNIVESWDMAHFASAGAIRADLADMTEFLRHVMSAPEGSAIYRTQIEKLWSRDGFSLARLFLALAASISLEYLFHLKEWPVVIFLLGSLLGAPEVFIAFTLVFLSAPPFTPTQMIGRLVMIALVGWLIKSQLFPKPRQVALGWQFNSKPDGSEILWHNGGTSGFRSFLGINQANGFGVVVLSSSAHSVDSMGFGMLRDLANSTQASKVAAASG